MSWKRTNENWYFNQISSGQWVEINDDKADKVIFSFDEVEIEKSNENIQVILFASDRNFYLSLNNKDVKFGSRRKSIDNILYQGSWQKNEFNENIRSSFFQYDQDQDDSEDSISWRDGPHG
jgi:hypothetical protein